MPAMVAERDGRGRRGATVRAMGARDRRTAETRRRIVAVAARLFAERGVEGTTMDEIARYLGMPPVAVYEVATFYNMYDLAPAGKHKICICTNLPCALSGAEEAAEHLKRRLGIGFDETTADGLYTLKQGECFGACGDAPVMLVNDKKMASFMNPESIDKLLSELK